jgi:hypothetical protein
MSNSTNLSNLATSLTSNGKISITQIANSSISAVQLDSVSLTGNGAIVIPAGTTSQQPAPTTPNIFRYSLSNNKIEWANGVVWISM